MEFLTRRFFAMGGQNEVQVCCESAAQALSACDCAVDEVLRIEAKYSRYRPDSVLSGINRSAGVAAVELDAETQSLMGYAHACFQASDGLFDVTSGVLRRAWNFSSGANPPKVPPADELETLLELVGWHRVSLIENQFFLPHGMEIDFGGLGKEYAADRACAALSDAGVEHGLVNLAGDTRVFGSRPLPGTPWKDGRAVDTTPWRIAVAHPRDPVSTVCTVALEEGALATSGDYERYFEIDGRRFCHILDPRSGMPVEYWRSVSVIAPLCIAAGSVSTISMLKGPQGLAFLEQQGLSFLAVDSVKAWTGGVFRV